MQAQFQKTTKVVLEDMANVAYRQSSSSLSSVSWKDAFYMGAVRSIGHRLQAQQQTFEQSSSASRALVVVNDGHLKEAVGRFFPNLRPGRGKSVRTGDAFQQGRRAGNEVALHRGVETASGSSPRLLQ